MKFNNQVAKREYKKLMRWLPVEAQEEVNEAIEATTERLKHQMLIEPIPLNEYHQQGININLFETDYNITLICWQCEDCDKVHVEVVSVEQFILN